MDISTPAPVPTPQDAAAIAERHLGAPARSVARFPMGLHRFVYDVVLADGRPVVVRMDGPGEGEGFAHAVAWHRLLVPRGVPLPALLGHGLDPADGPFPYMLLERLPGRDLWEEYPSLSPAQKRALARRIVAIQRAVGELPHDPGDGAAPAFSRFGSDVLLADLDHARARIEEAGVAPVAPVARVRAALEAAAPLLAAVEPRPFLDDTTTKNVIVHAGVLTGIVDVEEVSFGDPLLTPALTRTSLLNLGYDTDYIDDWAEELGLDAAGRARLDLYTAHFCVVFLSELGHRFNRDTPVPADPARVAHLLAMLDRFLP